MVGATWGGATAGQILGEENTGAGPQQKESNHKVTARRILIGPKKQWSWVGFSFLEQQIPQMIHAYKQLLYGCFQKKGYPKMDGL